MFHFIILRGGKLQFYFEYGTCYNKKTKQDFVTYIIPTCFILRGDSMNKEMTNSNFGKWGWSMILYTALLYYFWSGIGSDGLNLYPTAFAAMHGWDSNQLLGFATPAGIIAVFGGILFGRMLMKTGVKKMSGFALIVTGILYAVFGFVNSPVMYLVCLTAFVFVSMAFGLICTAALMGNWFPRKKGIALGWATMGAPICTATFVAIMSALYGMLGISRAHVVMGAVMVVLGIVSFFWVKDYPAEVGAHPDNLPDGAEAYKAQIDEMQSYKSPFTVSRLLKDKDMWLISVGFGMLWMVTVGVVSQFVPRMVSVMAPSIGPEAAQGKALLMLTIAAVVGIAGSYFWGWLDQKIGTKLASAVYSLSYIAALLLLIFAKVEILTYVAIIFVGLGIGGLLNLMPSLVISVYGRKDFAAANALVSPIASLIQKGAFIIMAVALAASGGDYTMPYLIFIGIDVIGLVLLLMVTNECKGTK